MEELIATFDKDFEDFIFDWENQNITYHYYKFGLLISSPITNVERYYDDGIRIHFKGGNVHIWAKNKLKKTRRPENLIKECKVCYALYNEYDDSIGFVFT